jgi:transposase-like protein
MRYPASEKLEIIQLVECPYLPAKQTLDMLGVAQTTFYRCYAQYRLGGEDALQEKVPPPGRIWNRISYEIRERLITLALDRPELRPREPAVTFTDSEGYFVSESSDYRLLTVHNLITNPAFIVMKAAREFTDKTRGQRAPQPGKHTRPRAERCPAHYAEDEHSTVVACSSRLNDAIEFPILAFALE